MLSLYGGNKYQNLYIKPTQSNVSTSIDTNTLYRTCNLAIDGLVFKSFCSNILGYYKSSKIKPTEFIAVVDKETMNKFLHSDIYTNIQDQLPNWMYQVGKLSDVIERSIDYELLPYDFIKGTGITELSKGWKITKPNTLSYVLMNSLYYVGSQVS